MEVGKGKSDTFWDKEVECEYLMLCKRSPAYKLRSPPQAAQYKGWLINSWLKVDEDELYGSCYLNVQFNSLSDFAKNVTLIPILVF